MYRDCKECGSKCCKFFGVPAEFQNELHGHGVSLDLYPSDPNPSYYFSLHEGVRITQGRFIVDKKIPIRVINTRLGRYVIVYSKCQELAEDGKCSIYDQRPEMCRNFVASTAGRYLVPRGCIFDHNGFGEDYDS